MAKRKASQAASRQGPAGLNTFKLVGKELIATLDAPSNGMIYLTPGMTKASRLDNMATLWEKWRVDKVAIRTSSSAAANSGGSLMIGYDADLSSTSTVDRATVAACSPGASGTLWKDLVLPVPSQLINQSAWTSVQSSTQTKLGPGFIYIVTGATAAAVIDVWLEYSYIFSSPAKQVIPAAIPMATSMVPYMMWYVNAANSGTAVTYAVKTTSLAPAYYDTTYCNISWNYPPTVAEQALCRIKIGGAPVPGMLTFIGDYRLIDQYTPAWSLSDNRISGSFGTVPIWTQPLGQVEDKLTTSVVTLSESRDTSVSCIVDIVADPKSLNASNAFVGGLIWYLQMPVDACSTLTWTHSTDNFGWPEVGAFSQSESGASQAGACVASGPTRYASPRGA